MTIKNSLLHGKDLSEHLNNVKQAGDAEKRTQDCQVELTEVLKKHNCKLDAIMIIGRNGVVPEITIVANIDK